MGSSSFSSLENIQSIRSQKLVPFKILLAMGANGGIPYSGQPQGICMAILRKNRRICQDKMKRGPTKNEENLNIAPLPKIPPMPEVTPPKFTTALKLYIFIEPKNMGILYLKDPCIDKLCTVKSKGPEPS
uniref:Uncharacterized protein n=1 Tax=Glossina pallidipes TaxID=7398 RepID=A0A1A9ZH21_GLOPL